MFKNKIKKQDEKAMGASQYEAFYGLCFSSCSRILPLDPSLIPSVIEYDLRVVN